MEKELRLIVKKEFSTSLFGASRPNWSKPYSVAEFVAKYPDENIRKKIVKDPNQIKGLISGKRIPYQVMMEEIRNQGNLVFANWVKF